MFILLIVSLLYSLYIFKLFWRRKNMTQHMVNNVTQTEYDSEIDDSDHLEDEDPVDGNENEMNHDTVDEFIVNKTVIKTKWW